jgi:hypothetical protein
MAKKKNPRDLTRRDLVKLERKIKELETGLALSFSLTRLLAKALAVPLPSKRALGR